jgi:predicted nucleic acid-binding protein
VTDLLLDTMVASELRRVRHRTADPGFASWAASVDLSSAFLSVITMHEMLRGVLLTERRDPATAVIYRTWLDDVLEAFQGRILDLTLRAAQIAAAYHIPDPAPLADALIAGTARAHGLTVATRNTSDFKRFGVPLMNPWLAMSAH